MKFKGKNKCAFSKKKVKFKTIKLLISSVYHPVEDKDQIDVNTFLSTIYSSIPQNHFFASGQDMNANIGYRCEKTEFYCIFERNRSIKYAYYA